MREIFTVLGNKSFREVQSLNTKKAFRGMMSEALQLSVIRMRETISQDLLAYASHKFFHLTITENEMYLLVANQMYQLIEMMIQDNTLLKMDSKSLNVDELYQAQMIKENEGRYNVETIDEEMIEFEGGSSKDKAKSKGKGDDVDQLLLDL